MEVIDINFLNLKTKLRISVEAAVYRLWYYNIKISKFNYQIKLFITRSQVIDSLNFYNCFRVYSYFIGQNISKMFNN
jgi:hypothetical protein